MAAAAAGAAAAEANADTKAVAVGRKRKRRDADDDAKITERSIAFQHILLDWASGVISSQQLPAVLSKYRIQYRDHQLNKMNMAVWLLPIETVRQSSAHGKTTWTGVSMVAAPLAAVIIGMRTLHAMPHESVFLSAVVENHGLSDAALELLRSMAAVEHAVTLECYELTVANIVRKYHASIDLDQLLERCVNINTIRGGLFSVVASHLKSSGVKRWATRHASQLLATVCSDVVNCNFRPPGAFRRVCDEELAILTFSLLDDARVFRATRFGEAGIHAFVAVCHRASWFKLVKCSVPVIDWTWGNAQVISRIPADRPWLSSAFHTMVCVMTAQTLTDELISTIPADVINAPNPISGQCAIHQSAINVNCGNLQRLVGAASSCSRPDGVDVWSMPRTPSAFENGCLRSLIADWSKPYAEALIGCLDDAERKTGELLVKTARLVREVFRTPNPSAAPVVAAAAAVKATVAFPAELVWSMLSYLAPSTAAGERAADCHNTMKTIAMSFLAF